MKAYICSSRIPNEVCIYTPVILHHSTSDGPSTRRALIGVQFELVGAGIAFGYAWPTNHPSPVIADITRPEVGVYFIATIVAPGLADVAEPAGLDVPRVQLEPVHDERMVCIRFPTAMSFSGASATG